MSTNGDKRSVSTDALETLGTIIGSGEARDAIHLAVEPVVAGQRLLPGQDIGLVDGKAFVAKNCPKALGIVDPFIVGQVEEGDRFWLVVYPRQIKSLRHVWEHPDFASSQDIVSSNAVPADAALPVLHDKEVSERWLRDFIANADCPEYETVIAAALNNTSWSKEYLHFDGRDAHGEIPPEFWTHVEIVTGKSIAQEDRAEYFSCSC
jgi:hypothetical protein